MECPVPVVTLDDLRAFQARHFIVRDQDFHQSRQTEETWDEEQYYDEDDDGLGYYPDGVKRTLTDEQIAIFRHSEIQRLLHERRLKAESEADKSEVDSKGSSVQVITSRPKVESNPTKPQARRVGDSEGNSTIAHNVSNYEDSKFEKPAESRSPGPTKTTPQPFHRRLVSYDD